MYGTICERILINKSINGLVSKKYARNRILIGQILNKIHNEDSIYGVIFISGAKDKNIIRKALSVIDDDELFLSILMKKYKI